MSRRYKKVSTTLIYCQHIFIFASAITGCISISAFVSLLDISIGIASSRVGLKICVSAAVIKKNKSIIKKKKKKHDKTVLPANSKLNKIEALISKSIIDSNISHDEILLKKIKR